MADTPTPPDLLALAVRVAADGAALAQNTREKSSPRSDEKHRHRCRDRRRPRRGALGGRRAGRGPSGRRDPQRGVRGGGRGSESRVRWILDPIDGTVNYLYGLPYYAVSLAAEVDGVVVAGVVHNTATGEGTRHCGRRGLPRRDGHGRRLTGSTETDLSRAGRDRLRVRPGAPAPPGRGAGRSGRRIRDIRRLGSGALDLCLAADGIVDAYYEKGLNDWDMAAGVLIATEAGLLVTGLDGGPPTMSLLSRRRRPSTAGCCPCSRSWTRPAARDDLRTWGPPGISCAERRCRPARPACPAPRSPG